MAGEYTAAEVVAAVVGGLVVGLDPFRCYLSIIGMN